LPTIPLLPLTHIIRSFTTLNPRRELLVPELSKLIVWASKDSEQTIKQIE